MKLGVRIPFWYPWITDGCCVTSHNPSCWKQTTNTNAQSVIVYGFANKIPSAQQLELDLIKTYCINDYRDISCFWLLYHLLKGRNKINLNWSTQVKLNKRILKKTWFINLDEAGLHFQLHVRTVLLSLMIYSNVKYTHEQDLPAINKSTEHAYV